MVVPGAALGAVCVLLALSAAPIRVQAFRAPGSTSLAVSNVPEARATALPGGESATLISKQASAAAARWLKSVDFPPGLPDKVDYMKFLTPVKDQGSQCGACWSFTATAAIEGYIKLWTGETVSLSEQQILDCSKGDGCASGGSLGEGFVYATDHPVVPQESYPYTSAECKARTESDLCAPDTCTNATINIVCNRCRVANASGYGFMVGYKTIPPGNPRKLMEVLAFHGPVAVAMNTDFPEYWLYRNSSPAVLEPAPGICEGPIDHAVLLVGYDNTTTPPAWILRNTYGPHYGKGGYFYLPMTMDDASPGPCQIYTFRAVYIESITKVDLKTNTPVLTIRNPLTTFFPPPPPAKQPDMPSPTRSSPPPPPSPSPSPLPPSPSPSPPSPSPSPPLPPKPFLVRLISDMQSNNADRVYRVEVLFKNRWGTVRGLDNAAAKVLCRSEGLGSKGTAVRLGPNTVPHAGHTRMRVWLQGPRCNGTEASLSLCTLPRPLGQVRKPLDHSRDSGIKCFGDPHTP